jgi:type VI secretion system secreted protein Hcp
MPLDADITVTGQKQGKFAGQNPIKSRAGSSVVLSTEWSIEAPRDNHTGLAVGKREHHPVTVHLTLDSAAINYQTAVSNNEVLTTVLLNFYQTAAASLGQAAGAGGSGGEAKPYYTMELKNAVVQKVEFGQPWSRHIDPELRNKDIFIKVSFTYQEITSTWVVGGKTYNDNWAVAQ